MDMIKPSFFVDTFPMASIRQKFEWETLAKDCIKLLAETGDKWRLITFQEYIMDQHQNHRVEIDPEEFKTVVSYLTSWIGVAAFSKDWRMKVENLLNKLLS
jgi:hypothetical protein